MLNNNDTEKDCNGQVFRYIKNMYLSKRGEIVTTAIWRPMLRLSCRGDCKKHRYGPVDDAKLEENMHDLEIEILCKNPVNGRLYQAVFVEQYKDWESGRLEEWAWEMVPYQHAINSEAKG